MKTNIARFIEFTYEKLTLLKQSERGEVWLAKDIASDDLVIMKYVKLTGLPYGVIQNAAFRLPAKIFFFAESETDTIVVEEYIRGDNMGDWLDKKIFFNEDLARVMLLQMCDGLKELHAQNIIHRDIKPSNLILQGGRFRLIDFDASRIFKTGQEKDTKRLGTQGYAAPEQYGSGQTDPRSDIYSLGVTVKNMLGDGYDGRLKNILDKCTEYDPARRFKNVSDLKRAVRFEKIFFWGKVFAAIFFAVKIFTTVNHMSDDTKNSSADVASLPAVEEKFLEQDENPLLLGRIKIGDSVKIANKILDDKEFPLSLGGLRLDDSVDTMHKIFGSENKMRPSELFPGSNMYEYKDVIVTVKNDLVTGIATYTDAVKDSRSLRQGDSLDKVIAAYGSDYSFTEEGGLTFYEYPFKSKRGNLAIMRFAVKNDVVEYIGLRLEN